MMWNIIRIFNRVSAEKAARIVALLDMLIGSLGFVVLSVCVKHIYTDKFMTFPVWLHCHRWVVWMLLSGSGIQCAMGVILMIAVDTRNLGVCRIWKNVSLATWFMSILFVGRLWQVFIVSKLCDHLQLSEGKSEKQEVDLDLPPPYHIAVRMTTRKIA